MAWNEPQNSDKPPKKPEVPPDLDQVLKDIQQKIKDLFGKKKVFFSNESKPGTSPKRSSEFSNLSPNADKSVAITPIAIFVVFILLLVWFLAGFFIVEPAEKAAILRFGEYIKTEGPGLHWIPAFIDSRYVANVQQVTSYSYHSEMLTQDENIVSVDLTVQYRISDLRNYLFGIANPVETLQQATASALRQVIGQTPLDDVLTSGREKVRQLTQEVLERTLAGYNSGLVITDVNMQPAKPPEEVTSAFDDAIKAREDEQRFKNQAVTYANRVVPIATGQASRLMAEANAYAEKVVLNSQAETSRFLAILPQYQQAPDVTRERMYLDTLQTVLSQSSKILVDVPQSNNMMYLPIDKLIGKSQKFSSQDLLSSSATNVSSTNLTENPVQSEIQNNLQNQKKPSSSYYPNRPSDKVQEEE